MPELSHKERLQPSLLDRLTDDAPQERVESREQRVLSPTRLRDSVLRDLGWLFNTTNLAALQDLSGTPEAARSVLNYGLPDLAGHTTSSVDVARLEGLLRQAIWDFEPRLIPASVQVHLTVNPDEMSHNSMSFVIEARLWAQPMPLRLYLRTEIDLEDGDVRIAEMREPAAASGQRAERRERHSERHSERHREG
jgi:type VI secretion system protein ImpF